MGRATDTDGYAGIAGGVTVEVARSFRLVPPEPRQDALSRPRLLRALVGRWSHRIVAVTGGPGLGKTTLLAEAIAENRLAPRGLDVWVGLEPHDVEAERLAQVLALAIAGGRGVDVKDTEANEAGERDQAVDPINLADAVWQRSPTEICLVLDDVHVLPEGSSGALWLADFVHALPANGHVVLAGRSKPPIPLTRYGVQGEVLGLGEDDLRFTDDELSSFAEHRGVAPGWFENTGGWPAMAEMAASVERRFTGAYLWEEVLQPLGMLRRQVLAVLCDLGGADDELASAAVGASVDLARDLDGVPLVARDAHGWYVPHVLWRQAPSLSLNPTDRREIRRRAVGHLTERGRFDAAFGLIEDAALWDAAPPLLRLACLATDRLVPSQLGRWLARSPDAVRASAAGRLATGLHTALTAPAQAVGPLQEAVARSRVDGDLDAELAAIAQLGQIAWWRGDVDALGELVTRLFQLESTGHPVALALASIARAAANDMAGDDTAVLAELDTMATGVLDTVWDAYAGWMCGVVHLDRGTPEATDEIIKRLSPAMDSATQPIIDSLQCRAWWAAGRVDEALSRIPAVIAAEQRTGPTYNRHLGQIFASIAFSYAGDSETARRYLDEAHDTAPPSLTETPSVQIAVATASLQLAEGDETAAAATLREALETHGMDYGLERRTWRQTLSLSYILVPETRSRWDQAALRGYRRQARDLAAALVAARRGASARLRSLDLPETDAVRGALHYRHAAELAVELTTTGRPEGRALLDSLGPPGRKAVRSLTRTSPRAKQARMLLAAVPAPPRYTTHLAVLGPLTLRRSDTVVETDLRRKRLQTLLAFLIGHRRTTRNTIIATLWPDLDDRAANNNLGVALNNILNLLEPWRGNREPAFHIRADGPAIQLVPGEHLRIDVDEFDQSVALAAQAETDGIPSMALEHNLTAVELYRDHLHVDLPDYEWLALDREHYRIRFVRAAVRAGHLLLGRGEIEHAETIARRALGADPWAEDAFAVLIGGALAQGDRSAAQRLLTQCLDRLADLGTQHSTATEQLRRRVQQVA